MSTDGKHAYSRDEIAGLIAALGHGAWTVRVAAAGALSRLVLEPSVLADDGIRAAMAAGRLAGASSDDTAAQSRARALAPMSREVRRELAGELLRSARSEALDTLARLVLDGDSPDPSAVRSAVRRLAEEVDAMGASAVVDVGELFALSRLTASIGGGTGPSMARLLAWIGSRVGVVALVRGLRPVLMQGCTSDRIAAAVLIDGAAQVRDTAPPADADEVQSIAPRDPIRPPVDPVPIFKNGPRPLAAAAIEARDQRPWPASCDLDSQATDRRINVWIGDASRPVYRLPVGTSAVVHFSVGAPVSSSLATGDDATVRDGEIPPAGLATRWTVVPRRALLTATDETTLVAASGAAVFDLHVPQRGDSDSIALTVTSTDVDAALTIVIEVGDKRWRELDIALARVGRPTSDSATAPLADVRLATSHEWTTPPGEVELNVLLPGLALVTGNVDGQRVNPGGMVDIVTDKAMLSGPVDDLRKAVDDFRKAARWTTYLNDIDDATLRAKLADFRPQYDWAGLDDLADAAHDAAWNAASTSAELHDLAFYGRRLYDTLFPPGKPGRALLDGLRPGHRVNIVWRPGSAAGWVRIPWDLLYRGDVAPGVPVEATSFWGLRYRIACTSYEPTGVASSRLGAPSEASCTSLLFFGESAKEPATAEAMWQRAMWRSLEDAGKPVIVPSQAAVGAKQQLVQALIEPERSPGPGAAPVGVLYLYCHYGADTHGKTILRFGLDSADPDHVIRDTELGTTAIASRPLVFANACATSGAGVYEASKLAKSFFDRGCRAYIGSECMVPVAMASRFAMVFFHFLLREVDPNREPISCGEALAQARLFLWCHYRNVGGLLYSYLNQYDLYLASRQELDALRIG